MREEELGRGIADAIASGLWRGVEKPDSRLRWLVDVVELGEGSGWQMKMRIQTGENQGSYVTCMESKGLQKVLGLVDRQGVGLGMTNAEDTVLADVVEFIAIWGAVIEFSRADALPAGQVIVLTSLSSMLRLKIRGGGQGTCLVLVWS